MVLSELKFSSSDVVVRCMLSTRSVMQKLYNLLGDEQQLNVLWCFDA